MAIWLVGGLVTALRASSTRWSTGRRGGLESGPDPGARDEQYTEHDERDHAVRDVQRGEVDDEDLGRRQREDSQSGHPHGRAAQEQASAGDDDADDAGRTLVLRAPQFETFDELVVGRGADDRDRPRMGHVGQERSERDGHRGSGLFDDATDLFAEEPPAQCRFGWHLSEQMYSSL